MIPDMTVVTAGEAHKLRALANLEARREVYVLRGRRALLRQLLKEGEASSDIVREAVELPPNVNPVCLGAVPGDLARAGIIKRDRFVPSHRPEAHHRPVSVWRLVDRAAALAWLTAHPDPDRPAPRPTLFNQRGG
jgi:hypothetical protein